MCKTNASILNGKFIPNITQKGKNRIWDSIAVATSVCGYAVRSTHEVKKKWSDMKRTSTKTGGGVQQLSDPGMSTLCSTY